MILIMTQPWLITKLFIKGRVVHLQTNDHLVYCIY